MSTIFEPPKPLTRWEEVRILVLVVRMFLFKMFDAFCSVLGLSTEDAEDDRMVISESEDALLVRAARLYPDQRGDIQRFRSWTRVP